MEPSSLIITTQESKNENSDIEIRHQEGNRFFVTLVVAVAVLATAILYVYFSNFNGNYGSQEVFGSFGDFIGGTLNPVFGFATIVLLIWSIRLQRKELVETRIEFKRSASAQEKIEKNQRKELDFYKDKEKIEHIKMELKTLDLKKREILSRPFSNISQSSLDSVINLGLNIPMCEFEVMMQGFCYEIDSSTDFNPLKNIVTDIISYTLEYNYNLQELKAAKQYELYVMKAYGYISFVEKLALCKLGTKIQLNGIANITSSVITEFPDLKDDTLNVLKTYILERTTQIYNHTQKM
jgi:uncharacterized membrane protein